MASALIGIVMGSTSDWETMKAAAKVLEEFGVPYEAKAMSAHRTPHAVAEWATNAQKNGMKAIIAAAGAQDFRGAADLAAHSLSGAAFKTASVCFTRKSASFFW